jgi:hypothetical protein
MKDLREERVFEEPEVITYDREELELKEVYTGNGQGS